MQNKTLPLIYDFHFSLVCKYRHWKIHPEKIVAQKTHLVIQCPADKVWSEKQWTVILPCSAVIFDRQNGTCFLIRDTLKKQNKTPMLDYIMLSRTSKMSDVNLIHDKHFTHSSQRKHSHFCQTVCCLACCQQSSGYAVPLPILHMEKNQNMVIDISLIPFIYFCLWTIQFKVGQDATIAKCVSNKLYPSQDGAPWRLS